MYKTFACSWALPSGAVCKNETAHFAKTQEEAEKHLAAWCDANGYYLIAVWDAAKPAAQHTPRAEVAAEWLRVHGQEVIGLAGDGVCVNDIYTRPAGDGYFVKCVPTWVPASPRALREFMNY